MLFYARVGSPQAFAQDENVKVYGTGYAHMAPAFEGLAGLTWWDVRKADGSLANYIEGSIYDVTHGTVILDDTWTPGDASPKMCSDRHLPPSTPNDIVKLTKLVELFKAEAKPKLVISKVSLAIFGKKWLPHVKGLLMPEDKPIARSVRVLKFGKLHNQEVYVAISNMMGHHQTSIVTLNGDISMACVVASYANKVIMESDRQGVKFASGKVRPTKIWLKLLSILPTNWAWYKVLLATKDNPIKGGTKFIAMRQDDMAFLDEIDSVSYEAVLGAPLPIPVPSGTPPLLSPRIAGEPVKLTHGVMAQTIGAAADLAEAAITLKAEMDARRIEEERLKASEATPTPPPATTTASSSSEALQGKKNKGKK
jgi:hypothetical protein